MVYDSRDERYKTPFGAVSCGTEVSFTLRPDPAEGFFCCTLLTHAEFADVRQETALPLQADGSFSGIYTAPLQPDLVWYSFCFRRRDGSQLFFGKNDFSDGDPLPYQLTVYQESETPQWFGAGVTYQIFPDRFCRLSVPALKGAVGNRTVHTHWDELPEFRPNACGEITNSDFFGGSLPGIISKLEYLHSLGVTTLYLCPIFEADSNHRYNTADYLRIDPMLGTEEDFRQLCAQAKLLGMRVMLDGVFNHTGSVSRYFNASGFYPDLGASQSQESPYAAWYHFHPWPTDYDAWWGIRTLPAVNETHPDYRRFIISGENSVVRHWLRCGASAWRLDVADELPDSFIAEIRHAMRETDPDSFLLGEVWEDASNKVAYSRRRRYFLGDELCGVMNYPFRTALLQYLLGGDASDFRETMETLRENYPHDAYYSCLNILGTHDTPRILTVLGAKSVPDTKEERADYTLSADELSCALSRLTLAAILMYTFPGSPTLFYGDEAGMQGFEDPLNRGTYPWGGENTQLISLFRTLGQLRSHRRSLQRGDITYRQAQGSVLVYSRRQEEELTFTALNAGEQSVDLSLPWAASVGQDALTGQQFLAEHGILRVTLPPRSGLILL